MGFAALQLLVTLCSFRYLIAQQRSIGVRRPFEANQGWSGAGQGACAPLTKAQLPPPPRTQPESWRPVARKRPPRTPKPFPIPRGEAAFRSPCRWPQELGFEERFVPALYRAAGALVCADRSTNAIATPVRGHGPEKWSGDDSFSSRAFYSSTFGRPSWTKPTRSVRAGSMLRRLRHRRCVTHESHLDLDL